MSYRPRVFEPSSLGMSLSAYLPAAVIYRAMGLVRGVVLTWLLVPAEYGLLQLVVVAINMLTPICGLGLYDGLTRYVPQQEAHGRLRPFVWRAVLVGMLAAGLACGLLAWWARPIADWISGVSHQDAGSGGFPAPLVRWAALAILITVAYMLLQGVLRGLRWFIAVSLLELVSNVGFTVVAVLAAWWRWPSAAGVLAAYCATYAGVALWVLLRVMTRPVQPPTAPHAGDREQRTGHRSGLDLERPLARLLRYSAWAAWAALVWQLVQHYPAWYLQYTHGPEAVAVFQAVRLLPAVVLIAAVSVVHVVQPMLTRLWESAGPEPACAQWALITKLTCLLVYAICVAMGVLAEPLLRMFPSHYHSGGVLMGPSLAFFMLGAVLLFLMIRFALIERSGWTFTVWGLGIAGNVLAAGWLVRPGEPAESAWTHAAWAALFGLSVAAVGTWIGLWVCRCRFNAGLNVLWTLPYLLLLPTWLLVLVSLALLGWIVGTYGFFSSSEKSNLARLPALVRTWTARPR